MLKVLIEDNCLIQEAAICNIPPTYFLLVLTASTHLEYLHFILLSLFSSYNFILSHNLCTPVLPILLRFGVIFQHPKALLFDWFISGENTLFFSAADRPQGFSIAQGHSHFLGRRILLLFSLLYPPNKTTDLQP